MESSLSVQEIEVKNVEITESIGQKASSDKLKCFCAVN
jgi:hypothetical protein